MTIFELDIAASFTAESFVILNSSFTRYSPYLCSGYSSWTALPTNSFKYPKTAGETSFRYLSDELHMRRKSREDLVEIVVDYLFNKKSNEMINTLDFLKGELK